LGDRINNVDSPTDERLTRAVTAALCGVRAPKAHLLGNHDCHDLSRSMAEAAMQVSFGSWSQDVRGHHLVFWNADTCIKGKASFQFATSDLEWLERDLASTELPVIVFSHLPLDDGSMRGNYYFESVLVGFAHYADSAKVRDVLERSGKVILCIAGHTHWNAINTIDGIHYVTIHSLTESFTTWPHPTSAWGLLQVGDVIEIEVFGRDPAWYRLPVRSRANHWASLTRPFAPRPADLSPTMRARLANAAHSPG